MGDLHQGPERGKKERKGGASEEDGLVSESTSPSTGQEDRLGGGCFGVDLEEPGRDDFLDIEFDRYARLENQPSSGKVKS